MPVITFNVADILRSKNLEKGWYSYRISKVDSAPSAKKDSINYGVYFTLIDKGPDYDGKEIKTIFNTKAISRLIPLFAAVKGIKAEDIKPESFDLDTDALVGATIDGMTDIDNYEGNLRNVIEIFAPYKSVAGKAPTF